MGLHKLTAGDGYLYLIRQVAAADNTHRGRNSLADYYSDKGEAPGRWSGKGLAALADSGARTVSTETLQEVWAVPEGSEVTEDQMAALFGEGLHPNAKAITEYVTQRGVNGKAAIDAGRLGQKFRIPKADPPLIGALAEAYRQHNIAAGRPVGSAIDAPTRAAIRTETARHLFVEQFERAPVDERELSGFIARGLRPAGTAVAGYDLTFSPVKSVSTLWAVAPWEIVLAIEKAHHDAVADVLADLERQAAFTRVGANGIAQVEIEGLIVAQFDHRDSRASDPDLHTHAAISNKCSTVDANGVRRWLALDGDPLHKMAVAASEMYNTRLETYLIERLGVQFAEVSPAGRGKRPIREIVGIPVELMERWSSRRAAIDARTAELAKQFQAVHGREPTAIEMIDLTQQATLETREAKHEPRSMAEQRQTWHTQAVELLGHRGLAKMLTETLSGTPQQLAAVDDEWMHEAAQTVIATVTGSRAHWQRNHVLAEAQRYIRVNGYAAHQDRSLAEKITAAALSEPFSVPHARITDTDLGEPALLRRSDGVSVYSRHGAELYTSVQMRAAEQRILAAARRVGGRRVEREDIELALADSAARGKTLNPGQTALVEEMASGGRRLAIALAPAGSGKTTAMAALSHAWRSSGGTVLGLAPTASAAHELSKDLNAPTDTLAKYVHTVDGVAAAAEHAMPARQARREYKTALAAAFKEYQVAAGLAPGTKLPDDVRAEIQGQIAEQIYGPRVRKPDWFDRINNKTLLIIDEAGKAGTLELDEAIAHALSKGANVRLVGDDGQLSSISAGGVLRDIAAETDALTLSQLVRFRSPAEAAATLALRAGDPAGLAFYIDHQRVHVGADATAADMAYDAWQADRAAGRDSLLLAPTNDSVNELNARARLDRLAESDARIGRELVLSDQLKASAGDVICTRKNNRDLHVGRRDFVRNGYRYTVDRVRSDGSLRVTHIGTGAKLTLPAEYIAQHVTLGYASTIDLAQGLTADFACHIVGAARLTRQLLYVALTRGKVENHIYLSTAEADPHRILSPKATHPETAVDVLSKAVQRDGAQVSATTAEREAADPVARLAAAADMYTDAGGSAAEDLLGADVMVRIDREANTVYPNLTEYPAWPVLRKHMARIAIDGTDPLAALTEAADFRELDTALDVAAVLDWRLDSTGGHSSAIGPLRWLADTPHQLRQNPEWGAYLVRRHELVSQLAEEIRAQVRTWTPATAPIWAKPILSDDPVLAGEIAVFRAAHRVDPADTRLLGPEQYAHRPRAVQRALEKHARRVIGRNVADTRRLNALIDQVNPRIRADGYWPQLAARLTQAAKVRHDLGTVIATAAAQGPLPDELPAAALWWRIAPTLSTSAGTLETTHAHLRPTWIADLHEVFGSAAAETIAADPAWPGLVAAIAAAHPDRWTPKDLLHVAAEHLADADPDHTKIPTYEYARLITYTIDLLTTDVSHTIPPVDLAHPPLSIEEEETLPVDPANDELTAPHDLNGAAPVLAFDDELPPPEFEPPPDPRNFPVDDDFSDLQFEQLSTRKPVPELRPALANVHALRAQYIAARTACDTMAATLHTVGGPEVSRAMPRIREMRERADADRPFLTALLEVQEQWAAAEEHYDELLAGVQWARGQYNSLLADPEADALDIESARIEVTHRERWLPTTSPAERFYPKIKAATEARAQAAGGADKVISHDDVDTYLRELRDRDERVLAAKRAALSELRTELAAAETETARAYAAAETRSAEHITEHIDLLEQELRVLAACTRYNNSRPLTLPVDSLTGLSPSAQITLPALARQPFTVSPVRALPSRDTTRALHAMRTAAAAADRTVIWCSPTAGDLAQAKHHELGDVVATPATVHTDLSTGALPTPAGTLIVIDDATSVEPPVLLDIIEHAAATESAVILLDSSSETWPPPPPGPSSRLMSLLAADLPWAKTLTSGSPIPNHAQPPDIDPLLVQAARVDPTVLDERLREALATREKLRAANQYTYRRHLSATAFYDSGRNLDDARTPDLPELQ